MKKIRGWVAEDGRKQTHKITTTEVGKSDLPEVEGLYVAVDEGGKELTERGTSGMLKLEDGYD